MDFYTDVGKEDCNTATDMENDLVTRIISMDLGQFLNAEAEAARDGSDEETTPVPVVRRNSMVSVWLEQAKQEELVEQVEQEEDPLGLEGLRRITPNGARGLDEEVEATTFSWNGLDEGAEQQRSTLGLLQLQPSASFQPSSSTSAGAPLLQPVNGIHNHQTQQNSLQQHNQSSHNQGLASSHNQGVTASHNQALTASQNPNVVISHNQGASANDIDIANVYVHPYPTKRNGRRLARSRSPALPPTNSRFGDGCNYDLNPYNHPSLREEWRQSQKNSGRSSWYNRDLSPGEVNPETNYNNWSTISNSDTVPPYQPRINPGSATSFQASGGSASAFQASTGSPSSFQARTGSPSAFQASTSSASDFQASTGSASAFQASTGSASDFQASNGSPSNFQTSTSLGAASSGLGYGFQPFSTVRNDERTRSQSLGGGMRPTLVGQPGGPRLNGRRPSGARGGNGRRFCNFCKTNGESSDVYLNHNTGIPGAVTCPNLFKHSCEICGATGTNAHTRGYCPQRLNNSRPVVLELKGTQRKSDGSFR